MNYNSFNEIDYFSNINNINNYNPYEGYIKGNLFKNLYDSYKNYKPIELDITSEQEEMLLNVNQLSFARHELNLLLDNYPNNRDALNLFNHYLKMEDVAIKNYERRFGPLEITCIKDSNIPFEWEQEKWPWDN